MSNEEIASGCALAMTGKKGLAMTGRKGLAMTRKRERPFVIKKIVIKKSLNFSKVSQHQLNNRPGKKLEFKNTL